MPGAWRLQYAVQYYDDHHHALGSLARRPELALLLETVERLQHRLDVSLSHSRGPGCGRECNRSFCICRAYLWPGSVRFAATVRSVDGRQVLALRPSSRLAARGGRAATRPVGSRRRVGCPQGIRLDELFPAGLLAARSPVLGPAGVLEELGSRGDPAAMPRWRQRLEGCETDTRYVLEALRDGVQIRSIGSPCASDSVVVLRPQLGPQDVARALLRGLSHEGKPYDFDFDFRRSDRLVCTEVVYRAYDGISGLQFPLVRRAGRPTLSGSDLIGMRASAAISSPSPPMHPP